LLLKLAPLGLRVRAGLQRTKREWLSGSPSGEQKIPAARPIAASFLTRGQFKPSRRINSVGRALPGKEWARQWQIVPGHPLIFFGQFKAGR